MVPRLLSLRWFPFPRILDEPPPATPLCFDSDDQFVDWLWFNAQIQKRNVHDRARDICVDCTPEYQGLMLEARRCAFPDVKFSMRPGIYNTENSELVGLRDGRAFGRPKKVASDASD